MMKLPLQNQEFRRWLPHAGNMSLLDTLTAWSPEQAKCSTLSHRLNPHPMAHGDSLGSACLIEYAAQAMALHGALLAGAAEQAGADTPGPEKKSGHGVLAGVRRLELHTETIQNEAAPLDISVTLASGNAETALYDFDVHTAGRLLASGRATVMFVTT